jgi:hypothetical protein
MPTFALPHFGAMPPIGAVQESCQVISFAFWVCAKLMCKTYVQNLCAKLMCKTYVQNLCARGCPGMSNNFLV